MSKDSWASSVMTLPLESYDEIKKSAQLDVGASSLDLQFVDQMFLWLALKHLFERFKVERVLDDRS